MKATLFFRSMMLNLMLLWAISACTHKHYAGFTSSHQQSYVYVSASQSIDPEIEEVESQPALVSSSPTAVIPAQKLPKEIHRIRSYETSKTLFSPVKDSVSKDTSIVSTSKGGKSQSAAFIMAIASWYHFAGMVPVHRFYLGGKKNSTAGILMIIFGLLTLGIVSYFWGLSDWIRILKGTLKPGEGDYNPKFKKRIPSGKSK